MCTVGFKEPKTRLFTPQLKTKPPVSFVCPHIRNTGSSGKDKPQRPVGLLLISANSFMVMINNIPRITWILINSSLNLALHWSNAEPSDRFTAQNSTEVFSNCTASSEDQTRRYMETFINIGLVCCEYLSYLWHSFKIPATGGRQN